MPREIRQMRERAAEIATEARTLLDTITDDMDAGQVAEIEGRFDTMMSDHERLMDSADREQRLLDAERRGMPTDPSGETTEGRIDDDPVVPEYEDVFRRCLGFGVSGLNAEERAVLQQHRAELTQEMRAQAAGSDAAGGYTVPEGFSGEIDRGMALWGPMWDANIVREYNTSSGNDLPWPTLDDTASRGRIKAENAQAQDDGSDDVVFGERRMGAYVHDTGIVRIPMELLQDSAFDIESLMDDVFGERLGRTANDVLTVGSGTNQPHGIVPAAGVGITVASNAAIASDELFDMQHSVDPAYRASPRCRWQFNDATLNVLKKLKDGDGNYLWQMGDIRQGEPNTLLNHPYSINQAMADIGASARSIVFGDHSRYVVRKVRGFMLMTLRERYAERFQIGMVGFKRFDGELLNSNAVKALVHPA
ncbi:MAG: phage major capsid protein [Pseudomonadota bacterium]